MSRKLTTGLGTGDAVGEAGIHSSGRLETLADRIDIGDLHNEADGFIRANDFIDFAADSSGSMDHDKALQAIEDGVTLGARLARQADGDPIQVVTANDAYGACRFYFIGPVAEVAARLKKLIA